MARTKAQLKSKLHIVASMMDEFTREENNAYHRYSRDLECERDLLLDNNQRQRRRIFLLRRQQEIYESALRAMRNQAERLRARNAELVDRICLTPEGLEWYRAQVQRNIQLELDEASSDSTDTELEEFFN